jgi:hypothetical protein
MNKKALSERDICTKFITPALKLAGWDPMQQIREEVSFTKGRIIVRGKLVTRGKAKRADYILYYKPNLPLALIEAKDNHSPIGGGIQQALEYAEALNIPFVFSSNGDGFLFHDRTGTRPQKETTLSLESFPTPAGLWARYRSWKGLSSEAEEIVLQDYFEDPTGKTPRYYQVNAINATVEAIGQGQNRILLVMATGTGKTYTAFQIIWRLWKAGRKKRILFLADRNVLVDQTMVNDFRPFGPVMAKLSTQAKTIEREDGTAVQLTTALDKKRRIDTAYEVYLGLYQAITGPEDRQKLFREFSPGFFDSSSWTNATAAAPTPTPPGARFSSISPRPPKSASPPSPKRPNTSPTSTISGNPLTRNLSARASATAFWPPTKLSKSTSTLMSRATARKKASSTATASKFTIASTTRKTSTAASSLMPAPNSSRRKSPISSSKAATVSKRPSSSASIKSTPRACAKPSSTRTKTSAGRITATSCASPAATPTAAPRLGTSLTPNRPTPSWSPPRACCPPASMSKPAASLPWTGKSAR